MTGKANSLTGASLSSDTSIVPVLLTLMELNPNHSALVNFTMPQLGALEKVLRGHARMLAVKHGRGDEISEEKMDMVNDLLHIVSSTLLEIETYDIIGDAMTDGTFEEIIKGWQDTTEE